MTSMDRHALAASFREQRPIKVSRAGRQGKTIDREDAICFDVEESLPGSRDDMIVRS